MNIIYISGSDQSMVGKVVSKEYIVQRMKRVNHTQNFIDGICTSIDNGTFTYFHNFLDCFIKEKENSDFIPEDPFLEWIDNNLNGIIVDTGREAYIMAKEKYLELKGG
jgi:hypothetical protein